MSRQSFEEIVLPHLDAAFNYARWLTRSEADAEDVVQDAYMRAFKFFSSFRGEDARAWLLTIVRNTWYGRFPRGAGRLPMSSIDETGDDPLDEGLDPEALLVQRRAVGVRAADARDAARGFSRGAGAPQARRIVIQGARGDCRDS